MKEEARGSMRSHRVSGEPKGTQGREDGALIK